MKRHMQINIIVEDDQIETAGLAHAISAAFSPEELTVDSVAEYPAAYQFNNEQHALHDEAMALLTEDFDAPERQAKIVDVVQYIHNDYDVISQESYEALQGKIEECEANL